MPYWWHPLHNFFKTLQIALVWWHPLHNFFKTLQIPLVLHLHTVFWFINKSFPSNYKKMASASTCENSSGGRHMIYFVDLIVNLN